MSQIASMNAFAGLGWAFFLGSDEFLTSLVMSSKNCLDRLLDFINILRVVASVLKIKAPHGSSLAGLRRIAETISPHRSRR